RRVDRHCPEKIAEAAEAGEVAEIHAGPLENRGSELIHLVGVTRRGTHTEAPSSFAAGYSSVVSRALQGRRATRRQRAVSAGRRDFRLIRRLFAHFSTCNLAHGRRRADELAASA